MGFEPTTLCDLYGRRRDHRGWWLQIPSGTRNFFPSFHLMLHAFLSFCISQFTFFGDLLFWPIYLHFVWHQRCSVSWMVKHYENQTVVASVKLVSLHAQSYIGSLAEQYSRGINLNIYFWYSIHKINTLKAFPRKIKTRCRRQENKKRFKTLHLPATDAFSASWPSCMR